MQILESIAELHQYLQQQRNAGCSIGLVPTMGNLHTGHMALIKTALDECDIVVATLFVNPTQFGPNEDYDKYPRSYDADKALLEAQHCSALFVPAVTELYPTGLIGNTAVHASAISERHCGASRPGHFDGVCTVVCKLFNLVNPDKAFFGKKDFQQLLIIKTMVNDLCMPIQVIGIETERDGTGLALSSRNNYLDQGQKKQARILYQTLQQTADALSRHSDMNFAQLEAEARGKISSAGLQVDYFTICNASTLLPATADDRNLVILTAAYLGETRLIDNISLTIN